MSPGDVGVALKTTAQEVAASNVTAVNRAPPPAILRNPPSATAATYSADSPRMSARNTMRSSGVQRMSGGAISGA